MYTSKLFQDILDKEYQTVVIKESSDSLTMQTARKGTALHDIYYKVKEREKKFFKKNM